MKCVEVIGVGDHVKTYGDREAAVKVRVTLIEPGDNSPGQNPRKSSMTISIPGTGSASLEDWQIGILIAGLQAARTLLQNAAE